MSVYKYLLFDADDTLFDFRKAEHEAFREICIENNVPWSEENYAVYSRINDMLWKQLEKGELSADVLRIKRFHLFLEWLAFSEDISETAVRMRDSYQTALGKQTFLMPDAEVVCAALNKVYPHMYIITNGIPAVQHARFEASPLRKYFEAVFISGEIGYSKPDPRYFQAVLDKIGDGDVRKYLVIGDSLTSDIKGACEMGMDSCFVNFSGKDIRNTGMTVTYTAERLTDLYSILLKESL